MKMQSSLNMYKAYSMFNNPPAGQATKLANANQRAFALFSQMETAYREWRKAQDSNE